MLVKFLKVKIQRASNILSLVSAMYRVAISVIGRESQTPVVREGEKTYLRAQSWFLVFRKQTVELNLQQTRFCLLLHWTFLASSAAH
jgi:hypothetical protein